MAVPLALILTWSISMNIYSVYWIRRQDHNDPYKQGYVGISCNVEQ
jgi:uncharacterized membrane protein